MVGYRQTNQKTDTGKTLTRWPVFVDHFSYMVDIEMIDEEEAMRMIRVSSRVTIRKYTERYNFPKPVRTYPKQYLRSAIVEWILNGGINQKSS